MTARGADAVRARARTRARRTRVPPVRTARRAERASVSLLLIVLILLVTTGCLGFFGVLDVSTALAYTGRFTGVLLIVAAAVVLLGAIAAVDHWYRQSFPYSDSWRCWAV